VAGMAFPAVALLYWINEYLQRRGSKIAVVG
jgi:hypothetical protein